MVVRLPNKSDFIDFYILETLKDSFNTPPSLRVLEGSFVGRDRGQRCGSKRLRSGRIKNIHKKFRPVLSQAMICGC